MRNRIDAILSALPKMCSKRQFTGFFTVSSIAENFGTSYWTALRAVSVLKRRGVLESVRGKGIRFSSADNREKKTEIEAARNLADAIEDRIRRGIYRVQSPLPKSIFLAATEHASSVTVAAAMRELARRRRIHKRGNRWYPGPPRKATDVSSVISVGPTSRVILLHFPAGVNMWFRISENMFVTTFYQSLCNQMQLYGLQCRTALEQERENHRPYLCGRADIRRHITELGGRYAGALIYRSGKQPTARDWIRFYGQFKQPVVIFSTDAYEDEADYSRRGVTCKAPYYHLVRDEVVALRLGVQALYDAGHRHIGILRNREGYDSRHYAIVSSLLSRHFPDIRVSSRMFTEDNVLLDRRNPHIVAESRWRGPQNFIDAVSGDTKKFVRSITGSGSMRARLARAVPSLHELTAENVSAIMTWNDRLMLGVYYWLIYAGYRVPEALSLISFDNEMAVSTVPLSTIDFGLEHLGYLAAHIFIRDFPVKADDRKGTIAGKPVLMDRGSLGPPALDPTSPHPKSK